MKKINKNFMFYIGYFLLLFSNMFSEVIFIKSYYQILNYIAIIILLIYFVYDSFNSNYSIKTLLFLSFCTVLFLVIFYNSRDLKVFKLLMLIMCFKNIDFDEFIKKDFKYRIIFLFIVISLYFMNFTTINNRFRFDGKVRYALGFPHPNTLGINILSLCFDYAYINRNHSKLKLIIVTILSLLANIIITDSRSCIIVLFIFLFYLILFSKFVKVVLNNKLFKVFAKSLFLILFIISLYVVSNYNNGFNWIYKLNDIFSGRIYLANLYLQKFGIFNLFGVKLFTISSTSSYALDNGYIYMLLNCGLIYSILIIILYYLSINKLYKNENYMLIVYLILWSIYLLMENNAFIIPYNPYTILFALPLFKNKKICNNRNEVTNE